MCGQDSHRIEDGHAARERLDTARAVRLHHLAHRRRAPEFEEDGRRHAVPVHANDPHAARVPLQLSTQHVPAAAAAEPPPMSGLNQGSGLGDFSRKLKRRKGRGGFLE